jgi:hypothetical protein
MSNIHMISPAVYVFGPDDRARTVYGWLDEEGVPLIPIVSNPDGPGIGPWHLYYGEDPWTAA